MRARLSDEHRRTRHQRRRARERQPKWLTAAASAVGNGTPLNTLLTVGWAALAQAGEKHGGTLLGLDECKATEKLWRTLRRTLSKHGVPFVAARAPEHDRRKGAHVHLLLHMPPAALGDVVAQLARLTGSPAGLFAPEGSPAWRQQPGKDRKRGVIAASVCRGWLLQTDLRRNGMPDAVIYATKAPRLGRHQPQYRLSHALSRLTNGQAAA